MLKLIDAPIGYYLCGDILVLKTKSGVYSLGDVETMKELNDLRATPIKTDLVQTMIVEPLPVVQNDIKERALVYLYKRIKKARIDIGNAEHKKGAAQEIEGLTNKIRVLEYLTELVLRDNERR